MSPDLTPRFGIELAEDQRLAWLRLIRSENIGAITFIELIKRYGTASRALDALPELSARFQGRPIRIFPPEAAEAELERIQSLGAILLCLGEPDYPTALRAVEAPPPVLTVLGNAEILTRNFIALVGSRNASLAGIKLTRTLALEIGQAGFATASGMARGIDSAVHEATLATGTAAVFAGGIDHIYPRENTKLARAIVEQRGALITEMPLGWQPTAKDFPRRNRIVAGLALGLVVVEAARRSGSLISARLANEMGRLVFAVPGSPLDPRSEGTNHLIQQGAQLVTSSTDILRAVSPLVGDGGQASYSLEDEAKMPPENEEPDDSDRAKVVGILDHTPVYVDEIIRHTGMEAAKVQMIILELDLAGRIERHAGARVSLL